MCVIGGGEEIPNWTDRQISEKKERTTPLTEGVIIPLLFETDIRFWKA